MSHPGRISSSKSESDSAKHFEPRPIDNDKMRHIVAKGECEALVMMYQLVITK